MSDQAHPLVGRRVRLESCSDPYTKLPKGLLGTVTLVDGSGTLHMAWDNGSRLGLIPGEDVYEVLPNGPVGS